MVSARPGRRPGRRPGPTETRETILASARALFAEKGYDGASARSIARAAGVDPALVHHFFGSKEGLFVAAMEFPFDPTQLVPYITAGPREQIGERIVRVFLSIWGDPQIRPRAIAIVRSASTSEQGAAILREFATSALLGRVADALGVPRLRINAAAGQMIGVMIMRYIVGVEPIASATEDELVELLAPTVQRYLD
ncbi:MAG: transcriptional regulator, TetR family [Actinomycetia bacterium]|nr:transcriptional regulator, TetR family [Actinomycetes bacterium]